MIAFTHDPLRARYPFGRKTQLRRRYDWDAQMYFNRVQAAGTELSVDEKSNISAFIRGLKALGAFGPMIDGWFLRSTQNVGTGSSVPGIKSVTGTLGNGPTWGLNGVSFAGAAKYMNTPGAGLPASPASVLAVGSINWATSAGVNYCWLGSTGAGSRTWGVMCNLGGNDRGLSSEILSVGAVNYTADTIVPSSGFGVWQHHQQSATTGKANIDGTEYATTALCNWDTQGAPGNLVPVYNGGPATSQVAFVGFFAMDTRAIAPQLRSLCKDTIGKGLNLP